MSYQGHCFSPWVFLILFLGGCSPAQPVHSEERPDLALRARWNALCLKAELILHKNREKYPIPYSPREFFSIGDYHYDGSISGGSWTSRATNAFARIYMLTPVDLIDYRFFQRYAEQAGGLEWDCSAMRCLFPPKAPEGQDTFDFRTPDKLTINQLSSLQKPVDEHSANFGHILLKDWEQFCQEAEFLQPMYSTNQKGLARTLMGVLSYQLYAPDNAGPTNAFLRMLGRVEPSRFDYAFVEQFVETISGSDWECPALRELLPPLRDRQLQPISTRPGSTPYR